MPDAVKSDATDKKTLREMCAMRGIEYHPAHRERKLRAMIDDFDERNAPPGDVAVDVDSGTGFSSDAPQTPEWAHRHSIDVPAPTPPDPKYQPAPETVTLPQREIPDNVTEALKWLGAYSIGRVNLVNRFIESLL